MRRRAYSKVIGFIACISSIGCLCPLAAYAQTSPEVFAENEVKAAWNNFLDKPITVSLKDNVYKKTRALYKDVNHSSRPGVIMVTKDKYKNLVPLGHAGIVYSGTELIESIDVGVVVGKNDWHVSKKTSAGLSVKRTSAGQDAAAARWARSQKGKPYNINFYDRDTRSRFYCSQLVWAAYKDTAGIDLDTPKWGHAIHPVELAESSEVSVMFRTGNWG